MTHLFENTHLLQTLVDKSLNIHVRKELAANFPENAQLELKEIFLNVVLGNVKGFPPKVAQILSAKRLLVFKIVDKNDTLSPVERREFLSHEDVLDFLALVLPSILKIILPAQFEHVNHAEQDGE